MRALLYCTKSKPYLLKTMGGKYLLSNIYDEQMHNMFGDYYNGKIVAEIEYEVENTENGYAIHITHCVINWTPRELDDYYNNKDNFITKAPQNMCYVYNDFGRKYVLMSVKPEQLAKILNREKTIEVRKKVLKEMLNDKQRSKSLFK